MKSFNIGELKIPVPIVQGGMGIGISLSGLASAVANLGGIGTISTVGIGLTKNFSGLSYKNANIKALKNEISKARKMTNGILGVNIMSVITNFSDMVKTSLDEGIDLIFSGAGLPLDLPKYLLEGRYRAKLVPIVSSGRAAGLISQKWMQNYSYLPDAFVVEGPLAGGHLGFKADEIDKSHNILETLVENVLKITDGIKHSFQKSVPVIAAGGLSNGKDIYQILQKGASAAQLGTRFIATHECDASMKFKNAFIDAKQEDVKIIQSPVGLPGRAIGNRFLKEAEEGKRKPESCNYHCIKSCDPKTTSYCIAKALLSAYNGDLDSGFAFTGSNVQGIDRIISVEELFRELMEEYVKAENSS